MQNGECRGLDLIVATSSIKEILRSKLTKNDLVGIYDRAFSNDDYARVKNNKNGECCIRYSKTRFNRSETGDFKTYALGKLREELIRRVRTMDLDVKTEFTKEFGHSIYDIINNKEAISMIFDINDLESNFYLFTL